MAVRPFVIDVPQAQLDDLHERLRRTRFLPDSPRRPASGLDARYLRTLTDAWLSFDWRERERWLNRHPQFVADVDGDEIHFVHLRAADPDAPAIVVMHGWPHTFALQLDFAEKLADFHVVLPSFPGFGFSPPYADRPVDDRELARTMHTLMVDVLGYERFYTYGEDVSAWVSDLLASAYPASVRGIIAPHPHLPTGEEREKATDPVEIAFFERLARDHEHHGAYGHVQATRPDTLAAALNDSPAGLLGWIVEKLVEWGDTSWTDREAFEARVSRARVLTEATIYWVTQSIGTSFRPYSEGADTPAAIAPPVVPAAVFVQRHEHDYPESVARSFYRDLHTFDRLEAAGHFTAAEQPAMMARLVREFARSLD